MDTGVLVPESFREEHPERIIANSVHLAHVLDEEQVGQTSVFQGDGCVVPARRLHAVDAEAEHELGSGELLRDRRSRVAFPSWPTVHASHASLEVVTAVPTRYEPNFGYQNISPCIPSPFMT